MFALRCHGEINGKEITLIPHKTYRVGFKLGSENTENIFTYLGYSENDLVLKVLSNNLTQYVLFNNINYIKPVEVEK